MGYSNVVEAAKDKQWEEVKRLVENGCNVEARSEYVSAFVLVTFWGGERLEGK